MKSTTSRSHDKSEIMIPEGEERKHQHTLRDRPMGPAKVEHNPEAEWAVPRALESGARVVS